jgi:hypothetical protein
MQLIRSQDAQGNLQYNLQMDQLGAKRLAGLIAVVNRFIRLTAVPLDDNGTEAIIVSGVETAALSTGVAMVGGFNNVSEMKSVGEKEFIRRTAEAFDAFRKIELSILEDIDPGFAKLVLNILGDDSLEDHFTKADVAREKSLNDFFREP